MYLIADYCYVPKSKETHKTGFWNNPDNFAVQEEVKFARTVKRRDMRSNVILNLFTKEIVKCSMPNTEKPSYEQLYDYYHAHYTETLDQIEEVYQSALQKTKDQITELVQEAYRANGHEPPSVDQIFEEEPTNE